MTDTMSKPTSNAFQAQRLFATDCTKYIQLHAKHARLKARMEVLRERILPELRDGKKSPRELPFLVVLQARTRSFIDWLEALKAELYKHLVIEEKVNTRLTEIRGEFGRQETSDALCVIINKTFQARAKP